MNSLKKMIVREMHGGERERGYGDLSSCCRRVEAWTKAVIKSGLAQNNQDAM